VARSGGGSATGVSERSRGRGGWEACAASEEMEVGDGRWVGATRQVRAEREGVGGVARPCRAAGRIGEGKGLTGGPRQQCWAAVPADRRARAHSAGFE
jgi:hypothetical protein